MCDWTAFLSCPYLPLAAWKSPLCRRYNLHHKYDEFLIFSRKEVFQNLLCMCFGWIIQTFFAYIFQGHWKLNMGAPKLMSSWVWKFSTISLSQGFNLLIHVTHSDFKMKNSKQIWSLCFTNMLIYTEWDVLGKHLFAVTILKVFL